MEDGPFERLDVLDKERMEELVEEYNIDTIYHLAALLSANAEKNIDFAWKLNMEGLLNVLNLARDRKIEKIDRKSTRLNSSHVATSYAVFCLKKKLRLLKT